MPELNFLKSYPDMVSRLQATMPGNVALEAAVGGDFETVGKLERALLMSLGLLSGHALVDVGCGGGRLAVQLSGWPELRYVDTDIVPELLRHARALSRRPDWRFELTRGAQIPCVDGWADMVCFFSVFTHLVHEDSFRYLREAKRVVKPGGRIVFSFLEFLLPSRGWIFAQAVEHADPVDHLNRFIERTAIEVWAQRLGLRVDAIFGGDQPHIPIDEKLCWANGHVMRGLGALGQSVAVLSRSENDRAEAT